MPIRISKALLILSVAFFYTLVVFNNATDYNSNFQFVRHTLTMDSTFPGNHGMWREIDRPAIHTLFYLLIIAWETVTAILSGGPASGCSAQPTSPPRIFIRQSRSLSSPSSSGC
nr:DUF2165 domain-containing protein [Granulicella sp. L60]